ncbi:ABC transporter ATP-binding protein [Flavobacterium sp. F-380]|uniref:ABC transporter ATP-binding protein n=1 Tax=Flavobacterium kayseriense TaxID=2764714 RepID=A0ABR7J3M3_9FLAO|nr:ABC transporter ATP-binding protein [Flavobacterium kayseriense]MBC5840008.1 ABC transporter ATP-binding protein [Flavobacterium kayseriense]MBC5847322.1 ABC transporter ATP-binding protein [Flavobacterium kayseriense]MBU0940053.1 ABC transporter ATP-binding protein/permease [Bacteroidota bacterium]
MKPLKRFYNLLELDKKDVYQLFFYGILSGAISLSLPLGIQAITNFIQAGRASVSWIVLIILVVFGVALVGILSLMQLRIMENLQQKIFIRSSFEFAVRLPKIKFEEYYNTYPPELANRFFDTLMIQKGTAKLLIDFSAALLQIIFGIILLSLYHPYFIFFGMLLLLLLYFIFKFSYNPGLETSMKESKYKYKVAGWLQEIARNNYSFRNQLHHDYALNKNDSIVSDYLQFREKHFSVIKTQFSQLIVFKMIITASLLSMGGYLVLSQQMNIGQFVAAEIIILLVINSVEKIVMGLETLYDVLTSVEKIGFITDMKLEEEFPTDYDTCYTSIALEVEKVSFKFPDSKTKILDNISLNINQGEIIYIDGANGSGKTTLIRILSGLIQPTIGAVSINDNSFKKINLNQYRSQIESIIYGETPFEGTLAENIKFTNKGITENDLKWALEGMQLKNFVKSLPNGLETALFPEGKQLSSSNAQKILLARSIISKPKILFYEDPTDTMDDNVANELIDFITAKEHNWTIIVSSKNPYWRAKCTRHITMENGRIILDQKK